MDKEPKLVQAIVKDNLREIKTLLIKKADIEERSSGGYTPLMVAARGGKTTIVKLLIMNGANVNEVSINSQMTAVCIAAFNGDLKILECLVQSGANTELGGATALMAAAGEGQLGAVKFLLTTNKAAINNKSASGFSALSFACQNNHIEVVRVLVELGADINNKCTLGFTPLLASCALGHREIASLLIKKGANIHATTKVGGFSTFSLSVSCGYIEIVKQLVEKVANLDETTAGGITPLMHACREGHLEIAKILIAKGCDTNHKSNDCKLTPLSLACREGHLNIVTYLLYQSNANPFAELHDKSTLLIETVKGGVKRNTEDKRAFNIAKVLLNYPNTGIYNVEDTESIV